MANQEIHNMTLLSQDTLVGFGGMGEGMAMQVAPDAVSYTHLTLPTKRIG